MKTKAEIVSEAITKNERLFWTIWDKGGSGSLTERYTFMKMNKKARKRALNK